MSCREPFVRAVAIADDGRLIFIAAPAAEPEFHGQLSAFERLGGFEQQSRRCEPAANLGVRPAEAHVRRERAQVLVLVRRAIEAEQGSAAGPPPPRPPHHTNRLLAKTK